MGKKIVAHLLAILMLAANGNYTALTAEETVSEVEETKNAAAEDEEAESNIEKNTTEYFSSDVETEFENIEEVQENEETEECSETENEETKGTNDENFETAELEDIEEKAEETEEDFLTECDNVLKEEEAIFVQAEMQGVYKFDGSPLDYKNNKSVNSGVNPHTAPVVVTKGKGNFKGTLPISFAITLQDMSNLTLMASDKKYENCANTFATNITMTDTNGKALSVGKDYDKNSIVYANANAVKLENRVNKKAGAIVEKTDIISVSTGIQVSVTAKAGGYYMGTVNEIYRIIKSDIKKAKVSTLVQAYTGNAMVPKKPDITVTIGGTKLMESEFEIVDCTNNIKKGNATITIKAKETMAAQKRFVLKSNQKVFCGDGESSISGFVNSKEK